MVKLTKAQKTRLTEIEKTLSERGISWSMGEDFVRRYNSQTGKPYITSRPANLTCSSKKLRALLDLVEMLPEINAALSEQKGER